MQPFKGRRLILKTAKELELGNWRIHAAVALARSRVCTKSAFLLDRHDSQLCAECLHRNQARTSAESISTMCSSSYSKIKIMSPPSETIF